MSQGQQVLDEQVVESAEFIRRAEALVPALIARGREADEARRVPDETIQDIADAGLFELLVPRELGGHAQDLWTYTEVVRVLAKGCMSTAWVAAFLIHHSWMLARYPQELRDEVFKDGPAPLAAGTGAPSSVPGTPVPRAVPVEGGYELTGQWGFASGVLHSDWVMLAAPDEGSGRHIQLVVPIGDVQVLDTWFTSGLRATGSTDVATDRVFVPKHRTIDWVLFASAQPPGGADFPDYPTLSFPVSTVLGLLGPTYVVGAAQQATEHFKEIVKKRDLGLGRGKQSESPIAQARVARVVGLVESARLHYERAVSLAVAALATGEPDEETRAQFRLSTAFSGQFGAEAMRLISEAAGGSNARLSSPIQRAQRDMNVILAHGTLNYDHIIEQCGRQFLGLKFSIPATFF